MSSNLMNIQFALALEADDTSQKMLDYLVNPESHSDAISSAIATNLSKSLVSILEGDKIKQVVIDALSIVDKAVKDVKDDTDETKVVSKSIITEIKDIQYVIDSKLSLLNQNIIRLDIPNANPMKIISQVSERLTNESVFDDKVTELVTKRGNVGSKNVVGKHMGVPSMDDPEAIREILGQADRLMLYYAQNPGMWDKMQAVANAVSNTASAGTSASYGKLASLIAGGEHRILAGGFGAGEDEDSYSYDTENIAMSVNLGTTGNIKWAGLKKEQLSKFTGDTPLSIPDELLRRLQFDKEDLTKAEVFKYMGIKNASELGGMTGMEYMPESVAQMLMQDVTGKKGKSFDFASVRPDIVIILKEAIKKQIPEELAKLLSTNRTTILDTMAILLRDKVSIISEAKRFPTSSKIGEDDIRLKAFETSRLLAIGSASKDISDMVTQIPIEGKSPRDIEGTIKSIPNTMLGVYKLLGNKLNDIASLAFPAQLSEGNEALSRVMGQFTVATANLKGALDNLKATDLQNEGNV